jgi:hypothetical protein
MGRWGSTEDEPANYEPPVRRQPRLRIRIETDASKRFAQRKATPTFERETEGAMPAKEFIKRKVLEDEKLQPRDMAPIIEAAGYSVSIVTVSNIRAEFRDSLKLLKKLGWRPPKQSR